MTVFKKIEVFPSYPNYLVIQWDVENKCLINDIKFNIYMSQSPKSEFHIINGFPIFNSFIFTTPFPLLFKREYLYFRVEAIINDKSIFSEPQGLFRKLPRKTFLLVKKMMKGKNLVREKKYPVEILVLKRRNFGISCDCIDPGTGLSTNSRCVECLGTRYKGGFFKPIPVIAEVDEQGTIDVKPSEIGNMDNISARIQMTFPLVQKGDIIIEKERNVRWFVNSVNRQIFATYPFDQIIEGRRISPKDIEYSIQLDIEEENYTDYQHVVASDHE